MAELKISGVAILAVRIMPNFNLPKTLNEKDIFFKDLH